MTISQPLRWLVIGVGDITSKRVLPAVLAEPRSQLVGIVTRDPAKAVRYGVPGWTSLEKALATSDAQAVYVASPVFLHASHTIASLRAGRHVLCEKPMALTYADACSMHAVAQASACIFGVAYYRRMYPKVARAQKLLSAGAIGRPVIAEATSHDWFYPENDSRAWLVDPRKSRGGPLNDIACHRIDLLNYLFGQPIKASGHLSTLVHPIDVEDNATVMMEHESQVRSVVDVRWHSRVARDEFRIRGTEGELDLSPLNGPRLVCNGNEESVPPPENLHYPCIENFVSAVRGEAQLRSTGASALQTEWVIAQVRGLQRDVP